MILISLPRLHCGGTKLQFPDAKQSVNALDPAVVVLKTYPGSHEKVSVVPKGYSSFIGDWLERICLFDNRIFGQRTTKTGNLKNFTSV